MRRRGFSAPQGQKKAVCDDVKSVIIVGDPSPPVMLGYQLYDSHVNFCIS